MFSEDALPIANSCKDILRSEAARWLREVNKFNTRPLPTNDQVRGLDYLVARAATEAKISHEGPFAVFLLR
eukprot:14664515-Heterocapsa_arctica.AAC.1